MLCRVCVRVCVCERASAYACVRERERERNIASNTASSVALAPVDGHGLVGHGFELVCDWISVRVGGVPVASSSIAIRVIRLNVVGWIISRRRWASLGVCATF